MHTAARAIPPALDGPRPCCRPARCCSHDRTLCSGRATDQPSGTTGTIETVVSCPAQARAQPLVTPNPGASARRIPHDRPRTRSARPCTCCNAATHVATCVLQRVATRAGMQPAPSLSDRPPAPAVDCVYTPRAVRSPPHRSVASLHSVPWCLLLSLHALASQAWLPHRDGAAARAGTPSHPMQCLSPL